MTQYELSRAWFDFCFENPEKIAPAHTAIFFFAIEHCNRLGWKDKFGFPTQMAMDALGISKHQTYTKYFNDIVDWDFFKLVKKSTNQYSSNIISLQSGKPKNGKALDKAIIKHGAKQIDSIGQSKHESDGSINKPYNQEPYNQELIEENIEVADSSNPPPKVLTDFQLCVDFWLKEFHPGFSFGTVHGKNMKSIITKIRTQLKLSSQEITDQGVAEAFRVLCKKLPDWFKNKDLQIIDSKFNEIISEIKNRKNGKSTIEKHRDAASEAISIFLAESGLDPKQA